jgi:hypothetical protein
VAAVPAAQVAHRLPGRLRIRVPDRRGDRDWAAAAVAGLAACPGVRAVRARALTGSLVIDYDGDVADVARFAARHGLFVLASPEAGEPTLLDQLNLQTMQLNAAMQRFAGGGADLWLSLSFVCFTLALVQVQRGNLMGPATSLAWAGLSALRLARLAKRSQQP